MRSRILFIALFFIFCLTAFFCAGSIAPSGGPPDLTPPVVLETIPAKGETGFKGSAFELKFNKYVDQTSFQQSVFLSPPAGKLRFDWSGKDVEISFSGKLRDSTTYVLTIGTDFHDTRNNKIASSFSLAFSTGENIDSGRISGRVFDAKPQGVMIYAYRLDNLLPDTLNVGDRVPDYLTQSGSNGTFNLSNLALGSYRVIAMRDQYKDLHYDVQTDEYGVLDRDLIISRDRIAIEGVQYKLTKEDTSKPFLSSARGLDRTHVLLRFSEPMRLEVLSAGLFSVTDTLKQRQLHTLDFSFHPEEVNEATLVVAPQESSHVYRVSIAGATDLAGNPLVDNPNNGIFIASTVEDTLKPVISFEGISDSAKNVLWNDTLKISSLKAIDRQRFEGGCRLLDDGGTPVPRSIRWLGASFAEVLPSAPFNLGKWYSLNIVLDSVRDYAGVRSSDSTKRLHFRIVSEKVLGSMKGKAIDERSGAKGRIVVTSSEISNKSIASQNVVADSTGAFEFRNLLEGKYILSAYRDEDNNGVETRGKIYPMRRAERFSLPSDTLKVRARWPLEGIVVRLN